MTLGKTTTDHIQIWETTVQRELNLLLSEAQLAVQYYSLLETVSKGGYNEVRTNYWKERLSDTILALSSFRAFQESMNKLTPHKEA